MIVIVQEAGIERPLPFAAAERDVSDAVILAPAELAPWLVALDMSARRRVEAVILHEPSRPDAFIKAIRAVLEAPLLAVSARRSANDIVELLDAGFDDAVRLPVHLRELLARACAIRRRREEKLRAPENRAAIVAVADGSDPLVGGHPLPLPRRERRILEFLTANEGKRVSRAQIFDAIYDPCDRRADEVVVESHVSRLRRKLRDRLGYDPVESKRQAGYLLTVGLRP